MEKLKKNTDKSKKEMNDITLLHIKGGVQKFNIVNSAVL